MKNIIFKLCEENVRHHFEILELVHERSSWNLLYQRNTTRRKALNKVAWSIFCPGWWNTLTLRFLLTLPWDILVLLRIAVERYRLYQKNSIIRSNLERIKLELLMRKERFVDSNEFMKFIRNF